MYKLKTESSFDAAHFVTDHHGKCENLHGHRWRASGISFSRRIMRIVPTKIWCLISANLKKAASVSLTGRARSVLLLLKKAH